MGTRSLTVVRFKNEYKVAQYCQWDGYPSGVGINILRLLKKIKIEEFKKSVDEVSFLTKEEFDFLIKEIDEHKKWNSHYSIRDNYPELSNEIGPDILKNILFKNTKKLVNGLNFAANSLFCEWAYVIDLDKDTFEVFKGFNEFPLDKSERFYFLERTQSIDGYYPVKLLATYSLDDLPDENDLCKLNESK